MIKQIRVGLLQVNAYFIIDEKTKSGVIIDPGADSKKLLEIIEENKWKIDGILLTHGHFDHIGAAQAIKQVTKAPIIAHKQSIQYLKDPVMNLSNEFGFCDPVKMEADEYIEDGEQVCMGNFLFDIIHVPGHTKDGVGYYLKHEGILFSGDALFKESIGRTDFVGGDHLALMRSIKNKLFTLPDDTVIYPGHGDMTTIKHEKYYNPYFQGWD